MRDRYDDKLDALFATARQETPDTTSAAEYFETRLVARLREQRNQPAPWQRLVWQLLPFFAAIAIIVIVCSITLNPLKTSDPFAALTQGTEEIMARNYLAGE
jgi:type IV secretory pathway component VirB8